MNHARFGLYVKIIMRPSRYNHHKVQNGDRSRQDKSDDKQPKWVLNRDQDKRSEARRSGELQVPWSNHLQRRLKTRDSFQDSPDNNSSFATKDRMEGQEHLACF